MKWVVACLETAIKKLGTRIYAKFQIFSFLQKKLMSFHEIFITRGRVHSHNNGTINSVIEYIYIIV